jgi:hypothetical protein
MRPYVGTYYSARRNFTTFERLMAGVPPANLSLDSKGNLMISQSGGTLQLVEVEPGLLRDPNDANVQIVLRIDEAGQAYLLTSDPWAYIKVPWYGTTEFRDGLVGLALLLFFGSLIGWSVAAMLRLLQHKQRLTFSQPARWVAASFGPALMALFVGLDTVLKTKDPIFGYPVVLIDQPPIFSVLMLLPYILAGLWLLMLVFTVWAWTRHYWSRGGRLHYTLLTLSGLSVLWGMWYWNLLF